MSQTYPIINLLIKNQNQINYLNLQPPQSFSPVQDQPRIHSTHLKPDPSHWRVWPKDSLKEGPAHPPPALEVPGCAHRTPWSSSCHQCRPNLGSGRDLGIGLGQVGINIYIYYAYIYIYIYIYIYVNYLYIIYIYIYIWYNVILKNLGGTIKIKIFEEHAKQVLLASVCLW